MLAIGEVGEAGSACQKLEQIAQRQGSEALVAMSAQARGAVALAEGDAHASWSRCAARSRRGSSSSRRTRSHLLRMQAAWPAGRWETKTRLSGS